TVTPGSTAPDASLTVPVMVAWAYAVAGIDEISATHTSRVTSFTAARIFAPLVCPTVLLDSNQARNVYRSLAGARGLVCVVFKELGEVIRQHPVEVLVAHDDVLMLDVHRYASRLTEVPLRAGDGPLRGHGAIVIDAPDADVRLVRRETLGRERGRLIAVVVENTRNAHENLAGRRIHRHPVAGRHSRD